MSAPEVSLCQWRTVGSPATVNGARHITHRPASPEEFLLGVTAPEDCRFTVSDQLPRTELPFEDAPGRTHDLHYVTEVMHSVARLASNHYLRLPADRSLKVTGAAVTIDDTEPWRGVGRPGSATVDLHLRSTFRPGRAPRLECAAGVLVRGTPYATGLLALRVDDGDRPLAEADDRVRGLPGARTRPSPARVGRFDGRNVVLADPRFEPGLRLLADITPDPDNPAFDPAATHRAGVALVVEATRQAAVLTVGELHGFIPARCVPVRWTARFPADGECGPPLRCRVEPGPVVRDESGRTAATVEVLLFGRRVPMGKVTVTVVQDC